MWSTLRTVWCVGETSDDWHFKILRAYFLNLFLYNNLGFIVSARSFFGNTTINWFRFICCHQHESLRKHLYNNIPPNASVPSCVIFYRRIDLFLKPNNPVEIFRSFLPTLCIFCIDTLDEILILLCRRRTMRDWQHNKKLTFLGSRNIYVLCSIFIRNFTTDVGMIDSSDGIEKPNFL